MFAHEWNNNFTRVKMIVERRDTVYDVGILDFSYYDTIELEKTTYLIKKKKLKLTIINTKDYLSNINL